MIGLKYENFKSIKIKSSKGFNKSGRWNATLKFKKRFNFFY